MSEDENMRYGLSILVVVCCIVGFFSGELDVALKIIGTLTALYGFVYLIESSWKRTFKKDKQE